MIKVTKWTKYSVRKLDILAKRTSTGAKRKKPVKLADVKFLEEKGEKPKSA